MEISISKNPKIYFEYLLDQNLSNLIFSYVDIWEYISEFSLLDKNQLIKYEKKIKWKKYSKGKNKLTNDIIKRFSHKIDWNILFKKWKDEYIIIQYTHVCFMSIGFNSYSWEYINDNKKWFYSFAFIDCFNRVIDWKYTLINIQLPIYIIDRYYKLIEKLNFTILLYKHQNLLNKNFIKKRKNELNWILISMNQKLNEDQIILYKNLVIWDIIFNRYKLSIKTLNIIEHYPFIFNYYINNIISTQNINEITILKYIHLIDPKELLKNNRINYNIKNSIFKNNINQYIYLLKNGKILKFSNNII